MGPIVIGDQLPARLRAKWGSTLFICVAMGNLIPGILGIIWHTKDPDEKDTMTDIGVYTLAGPALIAIARMICHMLFFRFDTATFYVEKISSSENPKEIQALNINLENSLEMTYIKSDIAQVREFLMDQYRIKTETKKLTLSSMLAPQYRYRLRAVLVNGGCRQFSGAPFFLLYATKIFDEIGQNGAFANFVIAFGLFLGGFVALWTVQVFGRKTNLTWAYIGMANAFALLCIMVQTEWYSLLYPVCLVYIMHLSLLGTASMTWRVETVPSQGVSINMALGWISVALVGQLTPLLTGGWPGPLG